MTDPAYPYRWHWRAKLPERHGQLLRVLIRGKTMNSCLVEFQDGWRCVTSRNALRRAQPAENPAQQKAKLGRAKPTGRG